MIDIRSTPYYNEPTLARNEYLEKLFLWKDKQVIKILTGVRRCGKSTILRDFCREIEKSVSQNQITFLNFEMLENEEFQDYQVLYSFLKNKLQDDAMNYIILDEIQAVSCFEKVVDSLFILPNVDIYLTGSNANMLSSEIATLLSGRYIEINILPFSFIEFQQGYKTKYPNHHLDDLSLYRQYIIYGGFPYLCKIYGEDEIVRDYILGLYSTIVLKDIQQRKKLNDSLMLEKIVRFALQNAGNLLSSKKISDTFISSGKKTSPATVDNYLSALCESYLFYKINRFDVKGREILKTLEKYYAVDMGLRFFTSALQTGDEGHILENIVFLEIKRRKYQIYIGKVDDMEVDFVVIKNGVTVYIQVALTVREEATLKRELRPLLAIRDSFPKILITMDNFPITYHNGIKQIYALDFLNGAEL